MTTDEFFFNSECKSYPKLKHKACELKPEENITAKYFKSRGLIVEKLCEVKSREGTPDFRLTDNKDFVCICEIKKLESPMGNLREKDWNYVNRIEFEQWNDDAKKQNAKLVVTSEQWNLAHGKISYSDSVRNTSIEENKNAKKIEKMLKDSSVGNHPLAITIFRNDILRWTEEELQNFVNDLIKKIELIGDGNIPRGWHSAFHVISGNYRKARKDGRYLQNQIQVRRQGKDLSVDIQFHLGVNWEAVEGNCRKAQKQIKGQLKRESQPEKIVRILVMYLEQDLYFEFYSERYRLETEINKRVFSKFPELSAIAFCENFDPQFTFANFRVFHTSNDNIPSLPKNIFNDGVSIQFPR